jgi:hypothetical protein
VHCTHDTFIHVYTVIYAALYSTSFGSTTLAPTNRLVSTTRRLDELTEEEQLRVKWRFAHDCVCLAWEMPDENLCVPTLLPN